MYQPYLIYGFQENEENKMIDEEWLEEHYPGINSFASDEQMFYGFICNMNPETGIPILSDGTKRLVKKLYNHKQSNPEKIPLGFYVVISGEYELDHERYRLDEQT